MQQRVKAYQVLGDELFMTSVTGPLLRCLSRDKGKELLAETHSGVCGGHIGSRALAAKVLWQSFYWPSVIEDSSKVRATCRACQKFSANPKAPSQRSKLITPSWPLQRWGIDIVGSLTTDKETTSIQ
jgi:hypothetical protein